MAKLIGHYFDTEKGEFTTFEIDGLKETEKQYKKVKETKDGTPKYSYEYWSVMRKEDLGFLRQNSGRYIMYSTEYDMPRFKTLVFTDLERLVTQTKQRYDAAVFVLEKAKESNN